MKRYVKYINPTISLLFYTFHVFVNYQIFHFFMLQGFVPLAELDVIKEQHDLELKNIQDEYELKVQQLLMEIEKMQTIQMHQVSLSSHIHFCSQSLLLVARSRLPEP